VRRLIYLTQARDDLSEIGRYITERTKDREVARAFLRELRAHCRKLAKLPGTLGRARDELGLNLRGVPHGNYVIFFRYADDTVQIISVIDGHRDSDSLFSS